MIALHNFRPDDFAPMLDIVADYRVVEMVGSWPWPAQPAFTKMRLTTPEAQAGKVQAICVNGVLAGTIGLVRGEIGYLLGRRFWGQGVASKAVATMLARGFRREDLPARLWPGFWPNCTHASARKCLRPALMPIIRPARGCLKSSVS
mgnify:CR=1 FL=1